MRWRGLGGMVAGGTASGALAAGALAFGVLAVWAAAPAVAAGEHRDPTAYPVGGTAAKGSTQGCADAPTLRPGRYLDSLTGEKDLWYRVDKRPDQVLEVSATALPTAAMSGSSNLGIGAGWAEGDKPESWLAKTDIAAGNGGVVSVGARSNEKAEGQTSACVHIDNGFRPIDVWAPATPLELVVGVRDKAAAAGSGSGPAPTENDGFSFAGARPLQATGTVQRGTLAIGEFPFYRVDVKDGQKLTVRAAMEHPASLDAGPSAQWSLQVYNALRAPMRCPVKAGDPSTATAIKAGANRTEMLCGPWQVDAAKKDYQTTYTTPGAYYVRMGVDDADAKARGQVVPYELQVTLEGAGAAPVGGTGNSSSNQAAGPESDGTRGSAASAGDSGGKSEGLDGTDNVLIAVAAGSALVSLLALAKHVRVVRTRQPESVPAPARSSVYVLPEMPLRMTVPGDGAARAPMSSPLPASAPVSAPGSTPAPAPVPASTPVPTPAPVPAPAPTPPPPPPPSLSIPQNHNALDSVWSISVVLGEDDDVADDASYHSPREDVTLADPPSSSSWRRRRKG